MVAETGAADAAPDGAASAASDPATPVATDPPRPGAAVRAVDRAADTVLTAAVAASAVGRMLREGITLATGSLTRDATACATDADEAGDGRVDVTAEVPRTTRSGAAGSDSAAETSPPFAPTSAGVEAGAAEERSGVASPAGALPLATVVGVPNDGAVREVTGGWDDGLVGAGRASGGGDDHRRRHRADGSRYGRCGLHRCGSRRGRRSRWCVPRRQEVERIEVRLRLLADPYPEVD